MRSLAKDPDDRFQSAEEMRGLVQYGLQMLQQQGGHTGTLEHRPGRAHGAGRHRPAMGMASAATTAHRHPIHGDTSQRPILPPMNPDDGGYDGGRRDGRRRGKMWLFVALALVAMVAGVAYRAEPRPNERHGQGQGRHQDRRQSPSAPPRLDVSSTESDRGGGRARRRSPSRTRSSRGPQRQYTPDQKPSKSCEPTRDPEPSHGHRAPSTDASRAESAPSRGTSPADPDDRHRRWRRPEAQRGGGENAAPPVAATPAAPVTAATAGSDTEIGAAAAPRPPGRGPALVASADRRLPALTP